MAPPSLMGIASGDGSCIQIIQVHSVRLCYQAEMSMWIFCICILFDYDEPEGVTFRRMIFKF